MTTVDLGGLGGVQRGLADVLEGTWERVIVIDAGGIILHVNAAFQRASGFTPDEVVGRHVATVYGRTEVGQWGELLGRLFAGESWTGEVVCQHRDGTEYLQEASVTPVINGGGEIAAYVAMTRDAALRREAEVHVRQGARMAALGQLASGIAHDFNNLLAAIRGFGEFVQEELPDGSLARRDMDEVMRAADSAADLTRQLLAFSRQQAPAPAPVDLAALIDRIGGILRRLVGGGIELVTAHEPGAGLVYADARGLEQVIVNLVVNARDAMPGGGTVTVGVEPAQVPADDGSVREVVRLTVRDTGTGMSPETLAHIEEPFFTTKEPGHGTGLGLATVYSVARDAGATVAVASAVGQGTTFAIDFPVAPAAGRPEGAPMAVTAVGGSETVLLVEDDALLRSLYSRHLRGLGYRVAAAPSAAVGLELARSRAVEPDVVVSDVALPGMRGPELVRTLRDERPGLPAVLITGLPDPGETDALTCAELSKPFTVAALAAAIRGQLDARPPRRRHRDAPARRPDRRPRVAAAAPSRPNTAQE